MNRRSAHAELQDAASPASARLVSRNSKSEIEALLSPLASGEKLGPDRFPTLSTLSPAFLYQFLPRPVSPTTQEYVYVPMPKPTSPKSAYVAMGGFLAEWNWAWEADFLRPEMFADSLPKQLRWLAVHKGRNIALVPTLGCSRFAAYSTLYRLLPREMLERFELPLLKAGFWPESLLDPRVIAALPSQFERRLEHAFAHHVWPLLRTGGRPSSFSAKDPLRLLAHNLDFWVPYIDAAVRERVSWNGRVSFDDDDPEQPARLMHLLEQIPEGFTADRPLMGGTVWRGAEEAWEATKEVIEIADADGRLRAIVDAVRSHRVDDDFSERWSWAKEDFERKLHHKRTKTKVRFVELTDTIPVHGPESEVHENLLYEDFLAVLDPKERAIVVCIRSGLTAVGDIAKTLGYANHSPVSKRLTQIRRRARALLED